MMRQLCTLLLMLLCTQSIQAQDCVILLHGLAKSDRDMVKIAKALTAQDFYPVNIDYPSRDADIKQLAKHSIEKGLQQCKAQQTVHFVTHSMGGILVRYYLQQHSIDKLGRVVMLGPPNQGSEVIDVYRHFPGFAQFIGPAGLSLGTQATSIPKQIGKANFEVGIIAGTHSINLILSAFLPGKDDGKVTVQSTKLEGMADHLIMPVTHPFMMTNRDVIKQVLHFLEQGKFIHQPPVYSIIPKSAIYWQTSKNG